MKRVFFCLIFIDALFMAENVMAGSVEEAPPQIIPMRIEAGFTKTVHIIFPSSVTYIDIGSMNILAGKADGADNVVRVKAAVRDFAAETNLTVITEDGGFYTFDIYYAENPAMTTFCPGAEHTTPALSQETGAEPAAADGPILLREVGRERPASLRRMLNDIYAHNRTNVKGLRSKNYGIEVEIRGIYVHNDVMYFHTQITNQTNLSFVVDARQFVIADRKATKRTAQQQMPQKILRVCNDPAIVRGHQRQRTVFALPKLTISNDKVLRLEILEKDGARHQSVTIPGKALLEAGVL